MKAGMDSILKRRANQDLANIKSKEAKSTQLKKMREKQRRIELGAQNQILKLSAYNLQRSNAADSNKRRTSCATEMNPPAPLALKKPVPAVSQGEAEIRAQVSSIPEVLEQLGLNVGKAISNLIRRHVLLAVAARGYACATPAKGSTFIQNVHWQ
jgi:hypothetical protein